MPVQRRAIAPAAKRKRAKNFLDRNTRFAPQNVAAALRILEIMDGVIFYHLPTGIIFWAIREDKGATFVRW